MVTRYRVDEVLQLTGTATAPVPAVPVVPAWDGRPATVQPPPDRPAVPLPVLRVTVDEPALATAIGRLGWRVYVTNQPATVLPLARAILAYRDEYLIERSRGRLKGRPRSLSPRYLTRDDHATGLVRRLSLARRVLTLREGVVRRQLADPATPPLTGYYPGQPARATRRPTAERLLAAFTGLTLTLLHTPTAVLRHLTPRAPLQQRLLPLLGCPPDTYHRLAVATSHPP